MKALLSDSLKRLRLSGLAASLDVRLQEAKSNRLDHVEFLELILQDELAVREQRLINAMDHVIEILRSGMERTMALIGRTSVAEIDATAVRWRRR